MSKSSARRQRRTTRSSDALDADVDAAEAAGDADAALALVEQLRARHPDRPDPWSVERTATLTQQVVYAGRLPGWVTSRWLLAQAARAQDPGAEQRRRTAQQVAREVRGGPLPEGASREHDWVERQLLLHDLGGLESFLTEVASASLIRRADVVGSWVTSTMGGFRLVRGTTRTLTWRDLGSGREVLTDNIGSASLLLEGESVIGRLVPTRGRPMFESAPLRVPSDVATRVAGDPPGWTAVLAETCRRQLPPGETVTTLAPGFRAATDVPRGLEYAVAHDATSPEPHDCSPLQMREHCVDLVRLALDHRLGPLEPGLDPWPTVASVLLEPTVFLALGMHWRAGDGVAFRVLASRLPEPASLVCQHLADLDARPAA